MDNGVNVNLNIPYFELGIQNEITDTCRTILQIKVMSAFVDRYHFWWKSHVFKYIFIE